MVTVASAVAEATNEDTQSRPKNVAEPDLIATFASGKPAGEVWNADFAPRPKTSAGEASTLRTPMSARAISSGARMMSVERYLDSGDGGPRIQTAPEGSRRRRGTPSSSESPVGQPKHSVKLPVGQGKLYTRFYRDPGVMDYVGSVVLFLLARARVLSVPGASELRSWCCGCSSGEEVYSVRMLWVQLIQQHFPSLSLSVHGTDISHSQLEIARAGVYSASGMGTLPRGWNVECFRPTISKNAPDAEVEVVCPASTSCTRETCIGRAPWVGLSVMQSRYASEKVRAMFQRWGVGSIYALLDGGLKCKVAHEGGEYGIYSTGKNKEFDLSPTSLTVTDDIKKGVSFAHQDVRGGIPEGPFDLVLSRYSTFLYLSSAEAWTALAEIALALAPGGFLVIGEREMLPQAHVNLGLVQNADCPCVYQKRFDPLISDPASSRLSASMMTSRSPSSGMLAPLSSSRPNTSTGATQLLSAWGARPSPVSISPEPRRTQSMSRLVPASSSTLRRSNTAPTLAASSRAATTASSSSSSSSSAPTATSALAPPSPSHAPVPASVRQKPGEAEVLVLLDGPAPAAETKPSANDVAADPRANDVADSRQANSTPSAPAHVLLRRSASETPHASRSSSHEGGHADQGGGHAVGVSGHAVPLAARYASLDAFLVEGLGRKGVESVLQRSPWHRVQKKVMSRTSRAILESSGKGQVYGLELKDRMGVEDKRRQDSVMGLQAVLRDINGGKGPGNIRKAVYRDGFLRRMQKEIEEETKKAERARKVVSTERMESFISRMSDDMSRRHETAKKHESELLKAALQADAWSKGQGKKAGLRTYRQLKKSE